VKTVNQVNQDHQADQVLTETMSEEAEVQTAKKVKKASEVDQEVAVESETAENQDYQVKWVYSVMSVFLELQEETAIPVLKVLKVRPGRLELKVSLVFQVKPGQSG